MAKLTLTDISSGYDAVDDINANNADIETAIENTLSRDGTSPNAMSANLDMNSNKITNLAVGTNTTDAATYGQITDHAHTEEDITDLGSYIENVSDDTTPTLGGDLVTAGHKISNPNSDAIIIEVPSGAAVTVQNQSETKVFEIDTTVDVYSDLNVYGGDIIEAYNSTNDEGIFLYHNDTDGIIGVSDGDLKMASASGDVEMAPGTGRSVFITGGADVSIMNGGSLETYNAAHTENVEIVSTTHGNVISTNDLVLTADGDITLDPASGVVYVGSDYTVPLEQIKYATDDVSITSDDTLSDDDDMDGYVIAANSAYRLEALLSFTRSIDAVSIQTKFDLSSTLGGDNSWGCMTFYPDGETAVSQAVDGPHVGLTYSPPTGVTKVIIKVEGFFVNTSTAKTMSFQWAQGISNASALVRKRGSYVRLTRIGDA